MKVCKNWTCNYTSMPSWKMTSSSWSSVLLRISSKSLSTTSSWLRCGNKTFWWPWRGTFHKWTQWRSTWAFIMKASFAIYWKCLCSIGQLLTRAGIFLLKSLTTATKKYLSKLVQPWKTVSSKDRRKSRKNSYQSRRKNKRRYRASWRELQSNNYRGKLRILSLTCSSWASRFWDI